MLTTPSATTAPATMKNMGQKLKPPLLALAVADPPPPPSYFGSLANAVAAAPTTRSAVDTIAVTNLPNRRPTLLTLLRGVRISATARHNRSNRLICARFAIHPSAPAPPWSISREHVDHASAERQRSVNSGGTLHQILHFGRRIEFQ